MTEDSKIHRDENLENSWNIHAQFDSNALNRRSTRLGADRHSVRLVWQSNERFDRDETEALPGIRT